jgi:hypothetical protein
LATLYALWIRAHAQMTYATAMDLAEIVETVLSVYAIKVLLESIVIDV